MDHRKLANEELDRLSPETFKSKDKIPLIVILDDVRSLQNVGSIFRTSDAFLVSKLYLCGITATPPHRDIQKTALGATKSVDWEYCDDIVVLLKKLKTSTQLYAVEQTENAISLEAFEPDLNQQPYAMIFGNEVKGVKQEAINLCDGVLEIPQYGTKHSLNIAVSAGIVIWEFWSKIKKSKAGEKK